MSKKLFNKLNQKVKATIEKADLVKIFASTAAIMLLAFASGLINMAIEGGLLIPTILGSFFFEKLRNLLKNKLRR